MSHVGAFGRQMESRCGGQATPNVFMSKGHGTRSEAFTKTPRDQGLIPLLHKAMTSVSSTESPELAEYVMVPADCRMELCFVALQCHRGHCWSHCCLSREVQVMLGFLHREPESPKAALSSGCRLTSMVDAKNIFIVVWEVCPARPRARDCIDPISHERREKVGLSCTVFLAPKWKMPSLFPLGYWFQSDSQVNKLLKLHQLSVTLVKSAH